jgi:hypothetical protein
MRNFFLLPEVMLLAGCGFISSPDERIAGSPETPKLLEVTYSAMAAHMESPRLCWLISRDSGIVKPLSSYGKQVSMLRSECFKRIANYTGDRSLCTEVRSVSTILYSGSFQTRETCEMEAGRAGNRRNLPEILISPVLRELNYSYEELDEFLAGTGRFLSAESAASLRVSNYERYLRHLAETLIHTEGFFLRTAELPNFASEADLDSMLQVEWNPPPHLREDAADSFTQPEIGPARPAENP